MIDSGVSVALAGWRPNLFCQCPPPTFSRRSHRFPDLLRRAVIHRISCFHACAATGVLRIWQLVLAVREESPEYIVGPSDPFAN